MSKKNLRKKIINLRRVNYVSHNVNFSDFQKILKKTELKNIINVGGYYPINSEIECFEILHKLDKNKFKISLPVIKKNNNMDYYEWSFKSLLKVSNRGIPEPFTKKKVYPDVLIVPLVGFDNNKFKLEFDSDIEFKSDETLDAITLKLNKILEEMILKNPDQWIWTHNRWK